MITRLRIQPAPGLVVRRPRPPFAAIPAEGCMVAAEDPYWSRLIQDGDVLVVPEPTPTPARRRKATANEVSE